MTDPSTPSNPEAAVSSPYETVDGPPPTPYQRARRRRRLFVGAGVVAAVLAGAVVVYVTYEPDPTEGELAAEDVEEQPAEEPEAEDEEPAEEFAAPDIELDLDDEGRPETSVPEEEDLAHPELERLEGTDRVLAEILLDVDASERAMLGFQLDVVQARDPDRSREEAGEADTEIRVAALHALEALAVLRARMEGPVDDPGIEEIRATYVVHLDSWVRWLEAIADDPETLNDQSGWFTIDINRTAAAFVRAVDDALDEPRDEDLDDEVVRYAEAILARGFPPPEDSPV